MATAVPMRTTSRTSSARSLAVGLVASLLAHYLVVRAVPTHVATSSAIAVSLEAASSSQTSSPLTDTREAAGLPRERAPLLPGGSTARENVDALRTGGGGDATGAIEFVLLVTESAPITLVDAPLNAADRSQVQRIDTASDRASWDDRRATPNPDDDPFLASGDGPHRERRPDAVIDPRAGARLAPVASMEGEDAQGREGASHLDGLGALITEAAERRSPRTDTTSTGAPRGTTLGAAHASPGIGIVDGAGQRSSTHAQVASGRPSVDLGPAATVAEHEGRVRDDTDAELLAAQLFESRVDASRRAGATPGDGRGGTAGAAGSGSGAAVGVGGHAAPYGPGEGAFAALDTRDGRYRTWLLAQRRRIEEHLVFPRARQLARDQGTSVVRLTIRRDGAIVVAPRVIRSSGFDDLDDAALVAVRGSLPFSPIPDDLAVGRAGLVVTLPIEFANPMVE